jgi:hypothetical protein
VLEVHAVDAGDEGQGHEHRGDDGEHLGGLGELQVDARHVDVEQVVRQEAVGLHLVEDA